MESFTSRLYKIVKLLFPMLPDEGFNVILESEDGIEDDVWVAIIEASAEPTEYFFLKNNNLINEPIHTPSKLSCILEWKMSGEWSETMYIQGAAREPDVFEIYLHFKNFRFPRRSLYISRHSKRPKLLSRYRVLPYHVYKQCTYPQLVLFHLQIINL